MSALGEQVLRPINAFDRRAAVGAALAIVAGLVVGLAPLPVAALLVAGVGATLAVLARPQWALYLLALSIPFDSLRQLEVGGASVGSTEGLVGLLGISWLLRVATQRERASAPRGLLVPIGLMLVAMLASTLRASDLGPAIKENVRWLEVLVVYLAAVDLLRTRRRQAIVLALLFGAAAAESLLGYAQFLFRLGPPSFQTGGFLRAYGTFGQPNPFAGYLGMLLPVALGLVLVGWTDPTARHSRGYKLAVAVFCVLLGAFLATMSRGGWLGFAFAVGVMASLFNRRAFLGTVVLGLGIAFVMVLGAFNLLPAQISTRLVQVVSYFGVFDVRTVVLTPENWAVVERMAIWQAAWGMFESSPLLGVGPGNYVDLYPRFAMPNWPDPMGHAHNLYLSLLAESGLVGLVGFLVFWLAAIRLVWRRLRSPADGAAWWQRAMPLGVLGVLAGVSLHNMFDNLMVHGLNVQLALLLALAAWSGDEGGKAVSA